MKVGLQETRRIVCTDEDGVEILVIEKRELLAVGLLAGPQETAFGSFRFFTSNGDPAYDRGDGTFELDDGRFVKRTIADKA